MDTILVIEDSDQLLEEISDILELEGFATLRASSGKQGLEFVATHKPDLVICDIMMPDMDGYQVIEKVRSIPKWDTLPFIFLTAMSGKDKVRKGMSVGANDYLTKPFATNDLIQAVQTQLRRYKELRQRLEVIDTYLTRYFPHELRTPLNSILGFSSIFADPNYIPEEREVREFGKLIYDNAQRLYRIADNHVAYANLQMQALSPDENVQEYEPLYYPCSHVYKTAAAISANYNRNIAIDTCSANVSVLVPENYFIKALVELADNALKFSSTKDSVIISSFMQDSQYCLSVRDNGRGMSKQELSSIAPFHQPGRQIHEQQGAGLGLAIVSMITSLYNADMEIVSVEGEYTVVTLRFPCRSLESNN